MGPAGIRFANYNRKSRQSTDDGNFQVILDAGSQFNSNTMPATENKNKRPVDAFNMDLTREQLQELTDACASFAVEHVMSLPEQPIWDMDGATELAHSFVEPVPENGAPIESLLSRISDGARKTFNTAGPGYLAFIPGGGIYPAALADFIAMTINRYVGVWNPAPALVQMELTTIDWIRELVGFPAGANGLLTSGGSISNLIAIVTARHTRLPENFLKGIIYTSREAHHCIAKAARFAGFPDRNVRYIDTDDRLRMRPDRLLEQIEVDRAAGLTPFLVVSNAGTTNTGAVDPTPAIADICDRENLWLHVDAAYGGFFRMLDNGKSLLPGLERADSLVLDPHKGLFVPYGLGCLLMRDSNALHQAHSLTADYMQDLEVPNDAVNFSDISPELSRGFRGLKLWLPFKLFGVDVFRENLKEKLELAQWAYQEIRSTAGFECMDDPQLSVVSFRYLPKSGDTDEFNRRLLKRVNEMGRVFITSTLIRGNYVLRFAVLSFRTHFQQLSDAVDDVRRAAIELES